MSVFRKIIEFYKDPEYFGNVQNIALPIMIQQLMVSGLNILVSLCAMSEEVAKWILGINRYFSRKWINNLTVHVEGLGTGVAEVDGC